MLIEMMLTVSLLGCGPEEPEPEKDKLPPGPNLVTPSPTTTEPYEIVLVKKVSWSADGSLAHYWLQHQNRKRADQKGWVIIGYLVDVGTGKTLASYQHEQKGFVCPTLKPIWDKSRPRAWGEEFLKKHGFVAGKKRVKPPEGKARLKLKGMRGDVGLIAAWPTRKRFDWVWKEWKKYTKEGQKLNAELQLFLKQKGEKPKQLHSHKPYLNYHYALDHRSEWKAAMEREENPNTAKFCGDEPDSKQCRRALRKVGLTKRNEYAFTGQVTIYWNQKSDAFLAFWDDRQVRNAGTDKYHVVFRSYVTVHSLTPRKASTLVPPVMAAVKKTPALMAPPMSGMKTTMATMAVATMKAAGQKGDKKKGDKKKGCGCQTSSEGLGLGLLFVLGLAVGLRRYGTLCRLRHR